MSGFSPRKGDRVESIRWPGHHGSVTGRAGRRVFVCWDGTSFGDEAALDELKPSRRAAPKHTSNQQLDDRRGI
jgi:hypothetical protein